MCNNDQGMHFCRGETTTGVFGKTVRLACMFLTSGTVAGYRALEPQ